jgi:hypothetical protein
MDNDGWFLCLDNSCVEMKNYCDDCKYCNKNSVGFILEEFLGKVCLSVVKEGEYEIFAHSDRLIKYVRVTDERGKNLLLNIDYPEEDWDMEVQLPGIDEVFYYRNDVCEFGPAADVDCFEGSGRIEGIKNLVRKYRSLIEEKFIEVDKLANG